MMFISGMSEWFFRSIFISSLFRISLALQARGDGACGRSKALQCGCNMADTQEQNQRNDIPALRSETMAMLLFA